MKQKTCDKCNNDFSLRGGNFNRHYESCDGNYKSPNKIGICKHCNEKFDLSDKPAGWMANHSRWCDKNPKRKDYVTGSLKAVHAMNETRKKTGISNQFTKAVIDGKEIPDHPCKGKKYPYRIFKHTTETKELLRDLAHKSRFWATLKQRIPYGDVILESSWELKLAISLDKNGISWERPEPIKWVDNGIIRNYYPDFYLPEFDLYIDPKNSWVEKNQKNKLEILNDKYDNIVILRSEHQCDNINKFILEKISDMVENNLWNIFSDISHI